MNDVPDVQHVKVNIDKIENETIDKKNVSLSMLRLDKLHPVVSGNKLFKLHYFLQDAATSVHKTIITFGGAYSSHLAATASACKQHRLRCVGIVRGEMPKNISHTLSFCKEQGMELQFISRGEYQNKNNTAFLSLLKQKFGEHIIIPEGGYSIEGAQGAELISGFLQSEDVSHICCAVGTATTLAGLITSARPLQHLIGFSALKGVTDFKKKLEYLNVSSGHYQLITDYHFGGYAKKTGELINFMNEFYALQKIPLDFVYTAKMMFGVYDLIKKDFFPKKANIICIHTGGLQGNLSLPQGLLNF